MLGSIRKLRRKAWTGRVPYEGASVIVSRAIHSETFVGRQEALCELDAQLKSAATKGCSALLITGDAGIGKTRLLAEFAHRARSRGSPVFLGVCYEGINAPFTPALDALLPLANSLGPQSLSDSALGGTGELLNWARGVMQQVRVPTVIALEDVHWSDAASLELFLYLMREAAAAPVAFVITVRSDAFLPSSDRVPLLARLLRERTGRIELAPFSIREMHALIRGWRLGNGALSAQDVQAIIDLAQGNPLFAEELARNVLERAAGLQGDVAGPSFATTVLFRTKQLDAGDLHALQVAAVGGRIIEPAMLAILLRESKEVVVQRLERALALQLLVRASAGIRQVSQTSKVAPTVPHSAKHSADWRDRDPTGAYRLQSATLETDRCARIQSEDIFEFRHPLTRESLYEAVPASTRRALHAQIALYLEGNGSHDRLAELAYHSWAARDANRTVELNERAGDAAAQRYALRDAAICYGRALDFARAGSAARVLLCEKYAYALYMICRNDEAAHWYGQALEEHRGAQNLEAVAFMHLRIALQHSCMVNPGEYAAEVDRAIEIATREQSKLHQIALIVKAEDCALQHRCDEARALSLQADALGEPDDPSAELQYSWLRAMIHAADGEHEPALRTLHLASESADAANNTTNYIQTWCGLAAYAARMGDKSLAEDAGERALEAARLEFLPLWLGYALLHRSNVLLTFGDLLGANTLLEEYHDLGARPPINALLAAPVALTLAAWTNNAELAVDYDVSEAFLLAERSAEPAHLARTGIAIANYFIWRNNIGDARAALQRTFSQVRTATFLYEAIDMMTRISDGAEGEAARALLEKCCSRNPRDDVAAAYLALAEANMAQRRREVRRGRALAASAARVFEDRSMLPALARALEAAGQQKKAYDILLTIGNESEAMRVRDALQKGNVRGRKPEVLTKRESQIADLLANGYSNRRIAARLGISERTVETHVASVLRRLNFVSRFQLHGRPASKE